MEDSNRSRGRVLAYLVSQGGRVTSGRNANLYGYIWRKISRSDYTHERVTALSHLIEAMAAEGMLELEQADSGRVFAISLTDTADLTVAEEDRELFDNDAVWLLVAGLQHRVAQLHAQVQGADEALAALAHEVEADTRVTDLQQRVAELEAEQAARPEADCQHEAEIAKIKARAERQLLETRKALDQRLNDLRKDFDAYRKTAQDRFSKDGSELKHLRAIAGILADIPAGTLHQIRQGKAHLFIVPRE